MKRDQKIPIPNSLQGQYAGFISRFLAHIVDILIIVLIVVGIGGITQLILVFFGLDGVVEQLEASTSRSGSIIRLITAVWGVAFIAILYYVLSWTVTSGKSVGKGLMGLRIVPLSGERMTLLRSLWRYLTFWFAVLVFGLGIFWILVSDQRQGWHDKLAKTCVIYDWPAREDIGAVERIQERWQYLKHTRGRLRGKRKKDSQPELNTGSQTTE